MPLPHRCAARGRLCVAALALTPLIGLPAAAWADEATPPPTEMSGVSVLGPAGTPQALPISTQSVSAEQIVATVNAMTVEDTLKYLPNVFVRRRHIGDTQAPITTRTSGVGSSARSLIYADGVLLSALIGNNNSTASPRWGMVSPAEVARIDVLYGPFSAAYPGNSIGSVIQITTRDPQGFEATLDAANSRQDFSAYATDDSYDATSVSAGIGDRAGPFSWRVSATHLDSHGQPLGFATVARPAAASVAGAPVSGAFADVNRTGAPIFVLGATGLEHQIVDNATVKVVFEPLQSLRLAYAAGLFVNNDDASAQTYLRDVAGAPVYAGGLNIGGYAVNVPAGAFSNGVYSFDERHLMQSLSAKWRPSANLRLEAIASLYDYQQDRQRLPTTALPVALTGGSGALVDMSGTGWRTFDVSLTWSPQGPDELNQLRIGAHQDRYALASHRFNTADWRSGPPLALASASEGRTETSAIFAEDTLRLSPQLDLTLGARLEHWRAYHGFNYSLSPALAVTQPELSASRTSPKAVLTWQPADEVSISLSAGAAYRFPTVSELYQVVTTGQTLATPNPDLRPEHAFSTELTVQRRLGEGHLRLAFFTETIGDALISQTAPVTVGSSTLASFVQNVGQVRSHGLELSFERPDILPRFDLGASATYVHSEITGDPVFPAAIGKQTPQVPRWRATLVATWRPIDRLFLTAAARYSTRVYATLDNSDAVTHTYQGFDGYLIVDLRVRYRLTEHWTAALGVDNAGNDDYFLFHPFPQRSVQAELHYAL